MNHTNKTANLILGNNNILELHNCMYQKHNNTNIVKEINTHIIQMNTTQQFLINIIKDKISYKNN